jgi:hypothetical protein
MTAMLRYFFNIRDGSGLSIDEEGIVLDDLSEAREEAILGARDINIEKSEPASAAGTLDVSGRADDDQLAVVWTERGGPAVARPKGLTATAVASLGGALHSLADNYLRLVGRRSDRTSANEG